MSLTLQVDAARWRAHLDRTIRANPGIVPVIKGNGYGFGLDVLLAEATRLHGSAGVSQIAVGTYAEARIALGGVAHKPWRDPAAEDLLRGQAPGPEAFGRVADHVLADAKGYPGNAFKIGLARRAIVRALAQAAAGTPQRPSDKHYS